MSKIIAYESNLSHSGIIGMKWGVRRYQNEDGTLTPEGRERYGYSEARKVAKNKLVEAKQKRNALAEQRIGRYSLYGPGERLTKVGRQLTKDYKQAKKDYKQAKKDYKKEKASIDKASVEAYIKKVENSNSNSEAIKIAYKETGKNFVDRFINNIKYS